MKLNEYYDPDTILYGLFQIIISSIFSTTRFIEISSYCVSLYKAIFSVNLGVSK
jgi:hypothetical protein